MSKGLTTMSKNNSNTGRVLPAQDSIVQGASEGSLAIDTSTKAGTIVQFDVNAMFVELKSKSAVIRALHAAPNNLKVNEIHKLLKDAGWKADKSGEPIRYQHVRNVLTQKPKKPSTASASVTAEAPAVSEASKDEVTA